MVGSVDGVMSIGSRGGVSVDEAVDDGRIGMDLCSPWAWWSSWKGLRRTSAAEAIAVRATAGMCRCGRGVEELGEKRRRKISLRS